jgi:hypothetical protein
MARIDGAGSAQVQKHQVFGIRPDEIVRIIAKWVAKAGDRV